MLYVWAMPTLRSFNYYFLTHAEYSKDEWKNDSYY